MVNSQNEQLGGVNHGAGEGEPPPLPAAQLGDEPVLQLLVLQLQHAEEARDLRLGDFMIYDVHRGGSGRSKNAEICYIQYTQRREKGFAYFPKLRPSRDRQKN